MIVNFWLLLEIAEHGWKGQEMSGNALNSLFIKSYGMGWKLLEMSESGRKLLIVAGNDWIWLNVARSGLTHKEISHNARQTKQTVQQGKVC